MATKSILRNIIIDNKRLAMAFVTALELASKKTAKDVVLSKSYQDANGIDIWECLKSTNKKEVSNNEGCL